MKCKREHNKTEDRKKTFLGMKLLVLKNIEKAHNRKEKKNRKSNRYVKR